MTNADLEEAKNVKLKRVERPTTIGVRKGRKDDLVDLVKELRTKNEELRALVATPLDEIYEGLHLPIKKEVGDLLIMNGKHKSKHGIIPAL